MIFTGINKAKNNLNIVYLYTFFESFLLVTPIVFPFFSSYDLSLKEIMVLQSVFAITVMLFEVPSGYLADRWGKKNVLILGSILRGVAFTTLASVNTFEFFVIYYILFGISNSCVSGTATSLLYDSLNKFNIDKAMQSKYLGRMSAFALASESISAVISGFVAYNSMNAISNLAAVISWIPLIIIWNYSGSDSNVHNEKFKSRRVIPKKIKIQIVVTSIYSVYIALITYNCALLLQERWTNLNVPLYAFGVIASLFSFVVVLGSNHILKLENVLSRKSVINLSYIFAFLSVFFLIYENITLTIISAFFVSFSRVCQITNENLIYTKLPEENFSTIASLISLSFRLSFAITAPFIGMAIDINGSSWLFSLLSIIMVVIYPIFLIFYIKFIFEEKNEVFEVG